MPFLPQVVAEESEEEKVDDKVSRSFMELRLRVFGHVVMWLREGEKLKCQSWNCEKLG